MNVAILALSLVGFVHVMARGAIWSPYYKITVGKDGADTVVEVNNIFHQSMAPVEQKEYFYQWPYMVFGDTFENVLILGAGSGHRRRGGAAPRREARRRGRDRSGDRPARARASSRSSVLGSARHVVNDDARHFLRTTTKKYDLVVFALIDSLTMQSSFSGVRLESYMFTSESFEAVRDHLAPNGLLVVYNYFREQWLVDRLANTAAAAFGQEPRVHVHEARAYLGVMLAGPRLATLTADPQVPDRVTAFGQSHAPSPARMHAARPDDRAGDRRLAVPLSSRPSHAGALQHRRWRLILGRLDDRGACWSTRGQVGGRGRGSSSCSAPASCCSRSKSIIQFALLWGSTWVVASLAIASVLTMALVANFVVSRGRDPAAVAGRRQSCWRCSPLNYLIPIGRIGFESRALESLFYAVLVFSPILCAGLLFGSAIKRSTVAGARLRHQPARRDGRRRRRISVAGDRLPRAAVRDRRVLHRRAAGAGRGARRLSRLAASS